MPARTVPVPCPRGSWKATSIECNFHGGRFNVRTGEVVGPPCMIPVKTYPVIVEDGRILIEVPD
jgi:nitrite reductase/ring-hydroxylating ferredoxin subunit